MPDLVPALFTAILGTGLYSTSNDTGSRRPADEVENSAGPKNTPIAKCSIQSLRF